MRPASLEEPRMIRWTAGMVAVSRCLAVAAICGTLCLVVLVSCDSPDDHIRKLQSPIPSVRREAAYRLLMRGESVVPRLLDELESAPDSTQFVIAQLLGKIGDRRAIEPLRALAGADAWALRYVAVEALGKMGEKELGPLFVEYLRHDLASQVRATAAEALANIRWQEGVDPLRQALTDTAVQVRKVAILSLLRLGADDLAAPLQNLAQDVDPTVRYVAVQLLGRKGDAGAVSVLLRALQDEEPGVREEAARALGHLRAEQARPALMELMLRSDGPDGEAAGEALEKITGQRFQIID